MNKHIGVWGDSVVEGFKDSEFGGWVNRLKIYFMNVKEYSTVTNCGTSGTTTYWLLKRFDIEAQARAPKFIIFGIGKNDSALDEFDNPWTTPKNFEKNLNKLILKAKKFTSEIMFVGIGKIDEEKTTPYFKGQKPFLYNKRISEYNNIIQKVCKENKLKYISIEGLLDIKEDLYDGLHPNTKGHKKIFGKVLKEIIED